MACAALLLAAAVVLNGESLRGEAPVPTPAASPLPTTLGPAKALPAPPEQEIVIPGYAQLPERTVLDQVHDLLESSYYRALPLDLLEQQTIGETLETLADPYTEYLSPADYAQLREELAGGYYGVGLSIWPGDGGLIVTSSLEGPARQQGIRPGDIILAIDNHDTLEIPFDRSAALMKGAAGTVVHLRIRREGRKKPLEITLVRQKIDFPAVFSRMLRSGEHDVGYIQVVSFREDIAHQVGVAAASLLVRGADGFVLDLRADPGGLLSQAVELTSVFLEDGEVCQIWSLRESRSYFATGEALVAELPLAVLVDRWTASAAEIVAAALSDNDRATLVGRRTYGKASVQTLFDLSNGGALKVTTATYLTPNDVDISETGIRPDVKVSDDPLTKRDEAIAVAKKVIFEQG